MKKKYFEGMELLITHSAKKKLCKEFNTKYKDKKIKVFKANFEPYFNTPQCFLSLSYPVKIYKWYENDSDSPMKAKIFSFSKKVEEIEGIIKGFECCEMWMYMEVEFAEFIHGELYYNGKKENFYFRFKEEIEEQLEIVE